MPDGTAPDFHMEQPPPSEEEEEMVIKFEASDEEFPANQEHVSFAAFGQYHLDEKYNQ